MRHIIRAGIQAPSGDNAQPWKFTYGENRIDLYLDRDADQSFFNVEQIASMISCGAVLENMRIAATGYGLDAKIQALPEGGDRDLMASLELAPASTARDPLSEVLWRRETNRKFYEKRPLPEAEWQALSQCVSEFPGARLNVVSERSDLNRLAKVIFNVDRIRTEHRPLHEHLCRMIRYTEQEALEKRDGLPLKNLEGGFAGELFLKMSRPWWVMNLFNRIGIGRMVPLHAYQGLLRSSGAALLTVQGMEPADFLLGGRALERVWLTITARGLAMQPMTAVTLFWLRWQLRGGEGFSEKHRKLLRRVWEDYRALFSSVDFEKEGHVMLFRLGYAEGIKQRTYRRDVDDFLGK